MHRARFMWVTCVPLSWLVIVNFTAGWEKVFSADVRVGFLAQASALEAAIAAGKVAAEKLTDTRTLIFNNRLDAFVCAAFMLMVLIVLVDSVRVWAGILSGSRAARIDEAPFVLTRLTAEEV
jgi:carbon starvation protein